MRAATDNALPCRAVAILAAAGTMVIPRAAGALPEEFLPRGDIRAVHDPTVVEHDGAFYLYGTGGPAGVIHALRSTDLVDWESIKSPLAEVPSWAREEIGEGVRNLWAPDVLKVGDTYHLYYSASRFGTNDSAIGLAVARSLDPASPDYGWEDRGMVIRTKPGESDHNAIDANVLLDEDGRLWMAFGSYWTGIKMVELDPATGKLLTPAEPQLLSLASVPQRPHDIEGPAILRHDGWHYLFVSRGACCQGVRSTYHIVVGRSRSITGPYVDRDGKPLMEGGGTLVLRGHYPVFGPGHNSVLRAMGREWIVHHFYDARRHWHGDTWGLPTLQVRPITWDEDGWPLPGESWQGEPTTTAREPEGRWVVSTDFGDWRPMELRAGGSLVADGRDGSWERDGSVLRLQWPDEAAPAGAWIHSAMLAEQGRSLVGRNQEGAIIRGRRALD